MMSQWTSEEVGTALDAALAQQQGSPPATERQPEDRRVKGTLGKSTDRRPPQRNENSQVTRQDRAGSFLTRQEVLDAADGILPEGKMLAVDGVPLREFFAGPIWMEHGAGTPEDSPYDWTGDFEGEPEYGYDPEHPYHKGHVDIGSGEAVVWKANRRGQPHHGDIGEPDNPRFVIENGKILSFQPLSEAERLAILRAAPGARFPRETKQAARGEYYHVAPARYRESILQHGLQGQQFTKTHSPWDSLGGPMRAKQPHGNYLSDNPYEAYTYIHGLKQRGRFPGAHDWNDHDWYQYGVQPHEYGETSYVDGPVEDQPAEWDDWDHDQRMQWYDEQEELHGDGAAVPYEGPHQLTERGVDPALHGWDIWKVNVDPDKHQILSDPEDAIHWRGNKDDRHPSMAEAIHNRWHAPEDNEPYADESMLDPQHDQYEEGSSLRWYVPQGIDPQYLQLHEHIPHWAVPPYNEEWPGEQGGNYEVPDSFARMPQQRYFGKQSSIAHRPGIWNRGLVTPTGEVHTWPESESTHNGFIFNALGDFSPSGYDKFVINPRGAIHGLSDPIHRELVEQYVKPVVKPPVEPVVAAVEPPEPQAEEISVPEVREPEKAPERDELTDRISSLADIVAQLAAQGTKAGERRKLIVRRDTEGRISSIEEETIEAKE
jgi:hypothetical protein